MRNVGSCRRGDAISSASAPEARTASAASCATLPAPHAKRVAAGMQRARREPAERAGAGSSRSGVTPSPRAARVRVRHAQPAEALALRAAVARALRAGVVHERGDAADLGAVVEPVQVQVLGDLRQQLRAVLHGDRASVVVARVAAPRGERQEERAVAVLVARAPT